MKFQIAIARIALPSLAGAALLFGLASPASATFIVSATIGGAAAGTTLDNLDVPTTGSPLLTLEGGAQLVTGSSSGQYAAPFFSGGTQAQFGEPCSAIGPDCSQYVSVYGGTDDAVLSFGTSEQYIGILWGSVDTYNTLCFYDASDVQIGCITGTDVTASANGDQGVSGTFYVNINSTVPFSFVEFFSSQNSFEFDDIAYSPNEQNVPEPLTISLFGAGLLGLGALRRRKTNKAQMP